MPAADRSAPPSAGACWGRLGRRHWLAALLVAAAVLLAYWPAYRADFIWDDDDYILLNPLVTQPGGWARIWNPASPYNPQYYPLVFTAFKIEHALWGLDPRGYHAVNIALHALAAGLLLVLLVRLRAPAPALVAALFALHPVFAESVAWITERKNVLSAVLAFATALAFLRYDERGRWPWLLAAALTFQLALLSKTAVVALPIGLGLILWWRRRLRRARVAALLILLAQSAAMGLVTRSHEYAHMLSEGGGDYFQSQGLAERLLVAGRAFWFYPAKLVWPADLAFFYSHWRIQADLWWQWLYPLAALAVAAALIVLLRRGRIGRGPLAAAGWYAVAIAPVLGFVNIVFTRYSQVADHFQYLPAVGVLALAGGAWQRLAGPAGRPRRLVALSLAAGVLAVLGALTWRHVGTFRDLGTLWAHAAKVSPDNWAVQLNRGVWLRQQGDAEGAAACYLRALELSPPPSEAGILANGNLSSIRFVQGRFAESLRHAEACLALKPDYPLGLYNKGRALWRLGRLDEAAAALETLLTVPVDAAEGRVAWDLRRRLDDARAWYVLAEVRAGLGRQDEALQAMDAALAVTPGEAHLHETKLRLLLQWRRYREAIAAAREGASRVPEPGSMRMQLALLLAAAPDASDRDGEEALAVVTAMLESRGDRDPHLLSILAAVQAELGRFAEAMASVTEAMGPARRAGNALLVQQLEGQLAAFRAGHAIRLPR